ncbi:hypothetical protein F183_A20500 [Bryobacterales bacterium F-183]|nr:hypothetical protein F183_A20500 [Bryobacterales bacterium F-183]
MYNDEYFQRTFNHLCRSQEAKANRRLVVIALVAAFLSLGIRAFFENPETHRASRVEAGIEHAPPYKQP